MEKEADLLTKFNTILRHVLSDAEFWRQSSAPADAQAAPTFPQFAASLDLWGGCRHPGHTQTDLTMQLAETAPIQLCVKLLCGEVFAEISMPRSGTVLQLCEKLALHDASAASFSASRLKLVFGDQALANHLIFSDLPFRNLSKADLQLIRCPHSFELGAASSSIEWGASSWWSRLRSGKKAPPGYDKAYNILLVGLSGSGKSALAARFFDDSLTMLQCPITIGIDAHFRILDVDGNTHVNLRISDMAGMDFARKHMPNGLTSRLYGRADAVIVNFDVTDASSFQELEERGFLDELRKYRHKDALVSLVGSKADPDSSGEHQVRVRGADGWGDVQIERRERCVTATEAADFAALHGMQYSEVDAKTGYGVHELFFNITGELLDRFPQRGTWSNQQKESSWEGIPCGVS